MVPMTIVRRGLPCTNLGSGLPRASTTALWLKDPPASVLVRLGDGRTTSRPRDALKPSRPPDVQRQLYSFRAFPVARSPPRLPGAIHWEGV